MQLRFVIVYVIAKHNVNFLLPKEPKTILLGTFISAVGINLKLLKCSFTAGFWIVGTHFMFLQSIMNRNKDIRKNWRSHLSG